MARTWDRVRRALRKRGGAAFLVASLAVGVLVGLASALLFLMVGWVGDLAGWASDEWGTWTSILIVPLGIFTAWLIARRLAPEIEKVEDIRDIIAFGIVATPAVAVDGVVKISGKLATIEEITEILRNGA